MQPTPTQSIVGGVLVAVFSAGMLLWQLLGTPVPLVNASVKVLAGKVTKTGHVGIKVQHDTLEIWIEGQPLPFRCFDGPYPGSFDAGVLSTLRPGIEARVTVTQDSLEKPLYNLAQNQQFYPLVALDLAGKPALTLQAYDAWMVKNRKAGLWLWPIMLFCGVYLFYFGVQARRLQRFGNLPRHTL